MKALPFLLALLLAWLAVASGYLLTGYPHFWNGGPAPNPVFDIVRSGPTSVVALVLLGLPALLMLTWLAAGLWQRPTGTGKPGTPEPGAHRDIWLAG